MFHAKLGVICLFTCPIIAHADKMCRDPTRHKPQAKEYEAEVIKYLPMRQHE